MSRSEPSCCPFSLPLSLTYVKIFAAVLVGLSEMLKAGTSLYFPTDPFPVAQMSFRFSIDGIRRGRPSQSRRDGGR